MSRDSVTPPPFPQDYRVSGLLLHVTSLPSPYGIGDVGPFEAMRELTKATNRQASDTRLDDDVSAPRSGRATNGLNRSSVEDVRMPVGE
jgi:hypothetical protein